MQLNIPLVLASRSPRRRHLLEMLGLAFEVVPSGVSEEVEEPLPPATLVRQLAVRKAAHVAAERDDALVLAADTVVTLDGEILEKPTDADEARSMLRTLSGRWHTVYTGVALTHQSIERLEAFTEATEVRFAELDDTEIAAYVETGSPFDKAGGYGIQDDRGALVVREIRGDYYNVVGLPVSRLYRELKASFPEFSVVSV